MPGVDTFGWSTGLVRSGQAYDITEIEATKEDLIERVPAQASPSLRWRSPRTTTLGYR